MTKYGESETAKVARFFAAVSDETRLRLLLALRHGEQCVCHLIDLVGLAPSTVSKHLSILRDAGWLVSRKEGRWVYYRTASPLPFPVFGKRASRFFQTLQNSKAIAADDRKLRRILNKDPKHYATR